jgi:hypothetical protein
VCMFSFADFEDDIDKYTKNGETIPINH